MKNINKAPAELFKEHGRLVTIVFLIVITAAAAALTAVCGSFSRKKLVSVKGQSYERAVVTEITKDNIAEDGERYGQQELRVKIKTGKLKGKTVDAISPGGTLFGAPCTVGMKVIVMVSLTGSEKIVTVYAQDRIIPICVFAAFFCGIVILIGGWKGFAAVFSLAYTFVILIFVMLPLLYRGVSPIAAAIAVSFVSTFVTLFLLGGMQKKTFTAIAGTTIGVTISGVCAAVFGHAAGITGENVSDIETLNFVAQYCRLNVGQLLFAGIIISSLGAVMDVGMSISSTIAELHVAAPRFGARELFIAGIHVGHDMMGTMTNTLILAFVGGALSTLMINYAYSLPVNQCLNSYNIGIEIMQGLSGSLGVVLTVPVTAFLAAWSYGKR